MSDIPKYAYLDDVSWLDDDEIVNSILRDAGYDPDEVGKKMARFAKEQSDKSTPQDNEVQE